MRLVSASIALASATVASAADPAVDPERQLLIHATNAIEGLTWVAAADSRFGEQPIGASKTLLGVDIKAYHARLAAKVADGRIVVASAGLLGAEAIPEAFDSATNPAWNKCKEVIGDIRDQSNCGCCLPSHS